MSQYKRLASKINRAQDVKSPDPIPNRAELEQRLNQVSDMVAKNPKKAVLIIQNWIEDQAHSHPKKKAG